MANTTAPDKPTRRSIKASSAKSGQQKRRDEALQRQQAARQDFTNHARQLATLASGSPADGTRDQVALLLLNHTQVFPVSSHHMFIHARVLCFAGCIDLR